MLYQKKIDPDTGGVDTREDVALLVSRFRKELKSSMAEEDNSEDTDSQVDGILGTLTNIKSSIESFGVPDTSKEYSMEEVDVMKKAVFLRENCFAGILCIMLLIAAIHTFSYLVNFIQAIYYVDSAYASVSFFEGIVFSVLPILIFAALTYSGEFEFENRRKMVLHFCVLNFAFFLLILLEKICIFFFVPVLTKIPVSYYITKSMVLNLVRFFIFIIPIGICIAVIYGMERFLAGEETNLFLMTVCIKDYIDFRPYKEYQFDATFVRRLDTAAPVTIKESDRFLHMLIDGTTGTGKTSSVILKMASDDFDQKIKNENYMRTQVLKLLKNNHVSIPSPISDDAFFLDDFLPEDEIGRKKFEFLKKHIGTAGFTYVAPNDSLTDDLYNLAQAKNLQVNRIDPILDQDGNHKEGFIGFNPYYIPEGLSPLFRNIEIVKKASVTADVLQSLQEMSGKSETYFSSLNKNITTCVSILLMLTYPRLHKENPKKFPKEHPTLFEFQEIMDSFDKVIPYKNKLKDMINKESESQRGFEKDTYNFVLCLVENDLLGEGRDYMFQQARGLRTLIDQFLANPLIREALCCQNTIDLDRSLRRGEITVVNYALELGKTDGVGFGLFYMLNYNNAVLRRARSTRWVKQLSTVDELPVILHPSLEENFTLFRQYNTGITAAIQTLDQMEKSDITKYMKGVLLGNCATHILFGRISTSEMKIYEELSGTVKEVLNQDTVSETSITLADTSKSFSRRSTLTDVPFLRGGRMRNLRFQQVTVFTVNEGSPLPPFYGKVNFLNKANFLKIKRQSIDWNQYMPSEKSSADSKMLSGYGSNVGMVHISNKTEKDDHDGNDDSAAPIKPVGHIHISCGKQDTDVPVAEEGNLESNTSDFSFSFTEEPFEPENLDIEPPDEMDDYDVYDVYDIEELLNKIEEDSL